MTRVAIPAARNRIGTVMRTSRFHLAAWLLAGFFVLAQGAALAHEYDHTLHKHDTPCAQHFFAGSLKAGAAASAPPALAAQAAPFFDFSPVPDLLSRFTAAYHGRAPPRFV